VHVRIAPGTPRRLSSSGRTSGLYPEGDPFKSGRRLYWAVAQIGRALGFDPRGSGSESLAPSSCLRSSSGQSVSLVRRRPRVRIAPEAPCGCSSVWLERDVADVKVAGSRPVSRSHAVLAQWQRQ
jgi:hypothetical protein